MRQNNTNRHFLLKIIGVLIVLFLVFVAVTDYAPESELVEKTVVYGNNQ